MKQSEVFIEYVNIPMHVLFQIQEITKELDSIFQEQKYDYDVLKHAKTTIRQWMTFSDVRKTQSSMMQQIVDKLELLDKKIPYPITNLHPFLKQDQWEISLLHFGFTKMYLVLENGQMIKIEKIHKDWDCNQQIHSIQFYSFPDECCVDKKLQEDMRVYEYKTKSIYELHKKVKHLLLKGEFLVG